MAVIRELAAAIAVALLVATAAFPADAGDTNKAFTPCTDTRVQRSDGFTLGIAFASKDKFFYNNNNSVQLSPCDTRLSLSSSNSQISVFRPKVDEISLLTVNSSSFVAVRSLSLYYCSEFRSWILIFDFWESLVCVVGDRNNRIQLGQSFFVIIFYYSDYDWFICFWLSLCCCLHVIAKSRSEV